MAVENFLEMLFFDIFWKFLILYSHQIIRFITFLVLNDFFVFAFCFFNFKQKIVWQTLFSNLKKIEL